jgi:hypothetical protein
MKSEETQNVRECIENSDLSGHGFSVFGVASFDSQYLAERDSNMPDHGLSVVFGDAILDLQCLADRDAGIR